MEPLEVYKAIERGYETSTVQFKVKIDNINQLTQEMVAFSNSLGGLLIIGVTDKGEIQGLNPEEIRILNQWIADVATQHIKPPISPFTEVFTIENKDVLVVEVHKGTNLPYYTKDGIAYVKKGSDKRIAPPEEILRMFQQSDKISADETVINSTTANDLELDVFKRFIKKKTKKNYSVFKLQLIDLLKNMGFAKGENLTLAGLLLFGKNPQRFRPMFSVQCVSFVGNEIVGTQFRDKEPPFEGSLLFVFEKTINFLTRNLRKIQTEKSFNSIGRLEIPIEVLEEIVVNALIHRDYFINSTINVFIFDNRVEIVSPGKLPNTLTVDNIKAGSSNSRNPILFTNTRFLLPMTGVGTGIPRALSIYPEIEFVNDQERERFIVIIKRP